MEFKSKYSPTSKFTPEGLLIIENGWEDVGLKILDSERYLRLRIKNALKDGLKILILPGGYDLLHAGHVTWIDQAIDKCIQSEAKIGNNISREDLFVVVPVSSDPLLNVSKRRKHISQGGVELFPRPIVSEDSRLLAVANLYSVDLTFSIPSPLALDSILQQPERFTIEYAHDLLCNLQSRNNFTREEQRSLEYSLEVYKSIKNVKGYDELKEDFRNKQIPPSAFDYLQEKTSTNWDHAAWDIMWHLFLSDDAQYRLPKAKIDFKRVVSLRDDYRAKADYISRLAGLHIDMILDEYITSTTNLISEYGKDLSSLVELVESSNQYKFASR